MAGELRAKHSVDRRDVELLTGDVGAQLLAGATLVARNDDALPHSSDAVQDGFDLTQLDPDTTHFYLEVRAADDLDIAVGLVTGQISRAIEPFAGMEGVLDEPLQCELWLVEVAARHSRAADVNLSDSAHRYRLQSGIQNVAACVGNRLSDRHGSRPARRTA